MKLSEIFKSISGEGLTQGYPTIFVRTIGCNLNCTWCDTNYAKKGGDDWAISDIYKRILELQPVQHIFFTGGEPLLHLQDIQSLIKLLTPLGYYFTIKTNGSMQIVELMGDSNVSFAVDIKMPSSGMSDKMFHGNYLIMREQDELMYCCADIDDWSYARDHYNTILSRFHCKAQPCFSPVWEVPKSDDEMPRVGQEWWKMMASLMIDEGPWNAKYSLQLHKCVWGPLRKGV